MFILREKLQLEKAIEKAKKIRPRVEFDCFGRYRTCLQLGDSSQD